MRAIHFAFYVFQRQREWCQIGRIGGHAVGVSAFCTEKRGPQTDQNDADYLPLFSGTFREIMKLRVIPVLDLSNFQVCFLPLMLVNVADDEEVRFPFLHILASVLAWASAVVNPFIYAFKNRQYQQAFAKVIGMNLRSYNAAAVAAGAAHSAGTSPANGVAGSRRLFRKLNGDAAAAVVSEPIATAEIAMRIKGSTTVCHETR